jgi:hypothetical protein
MQCAIEPAERPLRAVEGRRGQPGRRAFGGTATDKQGFRFACTHSGPTRYNARTTGRCGPCKPCASYRWQQVWRLR